MLPKLLPPNRLVCAVVNRLNYLLLKKILNCYVKKVYTMKHKTLIILLIGFIMKLLNLNGKRTMQNGLLYIAKIIVVPIILGSLITLLLIMV